MVVAPTRSLGAVLGGDCAESSAPLALVCRLYIAGSVVCWPWYMCCAWFGVSVAAMPETCVQLCNSDAPAVVGKLPARADVRNH